MNGTTAHSTSHHRVRYSMTVKDVQERVFPELDEEFFKRIYGEDTDILTEEACRNRVREDLKNHTENDVLSDARSRALNKIVGLSAVELPEKMLERRMKELREDDEAAFRAQHHYEMSDILKAGRRVPSGASQMNSWYLDFLGSMYL